jgi:hypothetical protein
MKKNGKIAFFHILAILAWAAILGCVVMSLWNVLLPEIFGLPRISYVQGLGLLALSWILFGGKWGTGFFHGHGNRVKERWLSMSDEEKKAFVAGHGFHGRFHHGGCGNTPEHDPPQEKE